MASTSTRTPKETWEHVHTLDNIEEIMKQLNKLSNEEMIEMLTSDFQNQFEMMEDDDKEWVKSVITEVNKPTKNKKRKQRK